jgi:hypothetical protein
MTFLRKESISGTADLTNLADNVFIIHRVGKDFEERAGLFLGHANVERYLGYDCVMEVAKNRAFGVVDYLVGMYYEQETRRLKNDMAENRIYGWQESPSQQEILLPPNPYEPLNVQREEWDMPFERLDISDEQMPF